MGAKEFDYYIFIDYSEDFLGYLIIENNRVREFIPKISKFAHYRELKHKDAYLKSIKKIVDKNKVCDHFCRLKIRKTEATPEIYSDVLEFIKYHKNCLVFICVDNKQFLNFQKLVKIIDGQDIRVVKESELKKHTPEYRISLVLDTLLNLARLKNNKF
ncbi:hypothetical protein HYT26_04610 [Candidatus Pacearchaeota archaeon]|nr:hypothetical protein [Candidatus Pacearchaeota archaeon]